MHAALRHGKSSFWNRPTRPTPPYTPCQPSPRTSRFMSRNGIQATCMHNGGRPRTASSYTHCDFRSVPLPCTVPSFEPLKPAIRPANATPAHLPHAPCQGTAYRLHTRTWKRGQREKHSQAADQLVENGCALSCLCVLRWMGCMVCTSLKSARAGRRC